tara:strand:- start:5394 stop:6545 length:1152 start_codon:yes stop_codon:yes gene_type:complete
MSFSLYVYIYVYLIVFYLWYRFLLRFISDIRFSKEQAPYRKKVTIVVPVYNEKPSMLKLCVRSLIEAEGEKQIVLIDDRSTDESWALLQSLKKQFPEIKIIRLKENKGKRYAQFIGLHFSLGDFVVTVDSDTVLKKNAITELLKPFRDPRVGATTGNARAFNRESNFLTKMIDARYKNAFTFERQGLSSFGIVTCCSGVISAYRTGIIQQLKKDYISQKFLGKLCTYGDDRHLTNLFIKKGYKIIYVNDAIAYTDVPTKFKQYVVQQLRWKKSFLRESLVILPHALKHNWLLALEVILNLVIPFLSLVARLLIIYLIFTAPITLIPIAISIVLIAVLRNILLFMEDPRAAIYSVPYAFIHELFIYWLYWVALFTMKDTGWGTR